MNYIKEEMHSKNQETNFNYKDKYGFAKKAHCELSKIHDWQMSVFLNTTLPTCTPLLELKLKIYFNEMLYACKA